MSSLIFWKSKEIKAIFNYQGSTLEPYKSLLLSSKMHLGAALVQVSAASLPTQLPTTAPREVSRRGPKPSGPCTHTKALDHSIQAI